MTVTELTALLTGALGFVISILNLIIGRRQLKNQEQQFEARFHQQQAQFDAQLALSREQLMLTNPDLGRVHNADLSAIQTLRGLLRDSRYEGRTLTTMQHHLPSRSVEEVRSLLRSLGAIKMKDTPETWRLPKTG